MSLDLSWNANKTTMKFDESIESRLKIHHYGSRLWKLRSFERKIGGEILDIDDIKEEDLRKNFQSKYKLNKEIKSKLKRHFHPKRIISSVLPK
jgi:hypothetical protein